MVRKLAAAAAVIGACAFIIPSSSVAKSGGGFNGGSHGVRAAPPRATGLAPNIPRPAPTMRARPPLYTGMAPAFVEKRGLHGRHVADRHHRRHHRHALGLGFAAAFAAPAIYAVPQDVEPAPGAVAVWRGNGSGVCESETVQVRGARGMDEVNIIRC
jgi:hypothetical protein